MFTTLISIALFVLPVIKGVAAQNDFAVGAPKSISSCQPATFTWQDDKSAPYNLVIVESTAPCGDILAELGDVNGTTYTWKSPSLPASYVGKNVTLSIEAANGDEGWSQSILYTNDGCTTTTTSTSATGTPGVTTIPAANVEPSFPPVASTSGSPAIPVGAANAGEDPLSGGALSARQTSGSFLVAGVAAALIAYSL